MPNLQVLVIGLDPYRVPGPWGPKPVADAIEARVTTALQARSWDCVVVGGGLRKPEDQLEPFESVVNLTLRHSPRAAIAFTGTPHDLAGAGERALGSRG